MNRTSIHALQLVMVLLFLSLLVSMLNMMGVPNPFFNPFSRPAAVPRPIAVAPSEIGADEKAVIDVFERISPSVVYITSSSIEQKQSMLHLDVYKIPKGSGTGFIWDTDGHIVTNFHVIEDADQIEVTMQDKSIYRGIFIGGDPGKDLAVLRIGAPKSKLQPIPLGTSADLKTGQTVLAIGNPFGLDSTLTKGVISALGRTISTDNGTTIYDVIQTDAAINPGNSGGPLLDSFGRLIAVNTAIYSPNGSFSGIGFAVPVDKVNRFVPQLISKGETVSPFLGVELVPTNTTKQWGIEGAIIMRVVHRSPAAKADLQGLKRTPNGIIPGDVLVSLDGEAIRINEDLFRMLDNHSPGDQITLSVNRDGDVRQIDVELSVRPNF